MFANKRGDILGAWIVVLTLVMCILSFSINAKTKDSMKISYVGPEDLMKLEDEKTIFENNEKLIILSIYDDIKKDISEENEKSYNYKINNFENLFCSKMYDYRQFIVMNLYSLSKKMFLEDTLNNKDSWINYCKNMYVISLNENIEIKRNTVDVKKIEIASKEESQIKIYETIYYSLNGSRTIFLE